MIYLIISYMLHVEAEPGSLYWFTYFIIVFVVVRNYYFNATNIIRSD